MRADAPTCRFRPLVSGEGYLDNYQSTTKDYENGAVANLICDLGYEATGETKSICKNKKWTVDPLVCKPGKWPRLILFRLMIKRIKRCFHDNITRMIFYISVKGLCALVDAPKIVGDGRLSPIKDNYIHKEKVKLICELGFEVEGEVETTCLNGKFTHQVFTCVITSK